MQRKIIFSATLMLWITLTSQILYAQTSCGGLGVTIGIDTDSKFPYIIEVVKEMPADKMNLVAKDFIVNINGHSTFNFTLEETTTQLKGPVGTSCNITIWRNSVEYPLTFTRAAIPVNDCQLYTNALPSFTYFTWTGDCLSGYCNGYGTLILFKEENPVGSYTGYMKSGKLDGTGIYYYSNGNKMLEGKFSNNMLNGSGKKYDSSGNLKFEGPFENDVLFNINNASENSLEFVKNLVKDVFDGGKNISSKIVGYRRYDNKREIGNDNVITELQISFNGNIVSSNYYEFKLRIQINGNEVKVEPYEANDMVWAYGIGKLGFKLALLSSKTKQWIGN